MPRTALTAATTTATLLLAGLVVSASSDEAVMSSGAHALVGAVASAASVNDTDGSGCPVAAHRGAHSRWTENSLNSARAAARDHVDYVEMDVQVTRDGRFVLMHDRTVDRTTTGSATGTITGKTWAQVHAMRLNDGQTIPTLSSVLAALKPSGTKVFIELKWIPASRWPALARLMEAYGADRVIAHSFSRSVVTRFRAAYPQVPTALDVHQPIDLTDAEQFGGVLVDGRTTTPRWREALHAHGVPVYLYGVNSPAQWKRYAHQVTVVITNHPVGYRASGVSC